MTTMAMSMIFMVGISIMMMHRFAIINMMKLVG